MGENLILDADLDPNAKGPLTENYASTGQRFINYLIDLAAYYALLFLLGAFLGNSESYVEIVNSPWFSLVSLLMWIVY